MRKLFLWAMLAVFVCSAGVAFGDDVPVPDTPSSPVPTPTPMPDTPEELPISSEAILDVGLYRVFSTDQPVILRADGEPYFENVTAFVGTGMNLAVKVKPGYSGGNYTMPQGTLTDTATGLRYKLTPGDWSGNFCTYDVNADLATLAGHKVMWNLYSSPDVINGYP